MHLQNYEPKAGVRNSKASSPRRFSSSLKTSRSAKGIPGCLSGTAVTSHYITGSLSNDWYNEGDCALGNFVSTQRCWEPTKHRCERRAFLNSFNRWYFSHYVGETVQCHVQLKEFAKLCETAFTFPDFNGYNHGHLLQNRGPADLAARRAAHGHDLQFLTLLRQLRVHHLPPRIWNKARIFEANNVSFKEINKEEYDNWPISIRRSIPHRDGRKHHQKIHSQTAIESRCVIAFSKDYLTFVLEQLSDLDGISYRAMMGEHVLYFRDKIVGGIYDDRLLSKRQLQPRSRQRNQPS